MDKNSRDNQNMIFDTGIYLVAKFLEGIIGIFVLSRYTYYFSEIAYGNYIKLNTTIQILSSFSTLWLAQSMYRFFKKYDDENDLTSFFSTSVALWFSINFLLVTLSLFLMFFVSNNNLIDIDINILIMATVAFVAFNTQNIVTTTLASGRKTKFNLFLSISSAFGKLIMIVLLVTFYENSIILIFISNAVIDTTISILGIIKLKVYKYTSVNKISKEIAKEFFAYGTPFLGSILTTTLINNSDRYIISGDEVAIYVTNYSVISTLFTMINTGVSRGSVPTIYNVHTSGDVDRAYGLVAQLVKYYLIIIVPLVFGVAFISKELAMILFPVSYTEAHRVMVFIAAALTLSFLTECSNKSFELNKDTKYIFMYSFIGGSINLILNILFVPLYGYMFAAFTTLLGFTVYFILSKSRSIKYFKWKLGKTFYFKVFGSATLMFIIISLLKYFLGNSIINMIIYIVIAIILYFGMLYFNGLMKNEIDNGFLIIKKYKKR